jgi:hypothetical protein
MITVSSSRFDRGNPRQAKKGLSYVPGGRAWIKTKNKEYSRYEMEREGAFRHRRERQVV